MSVKANKSLDDGLVLYLPMNEGSGSTGFDRAKGNNNAIIPSDIWEVDTEKGVVPHFNSLASKNLDIPASTDYDLQEQTISFWFKIDAIDGLSVHVLRRIESSTFTNWMFYRNAQWSNGELGLCIYYMGTDAIAHSLLIRRIGWEINTWYHVCMVLHADGKSEDYVNGVLWSDNAIPADFDYWITSTYKHYTSMQGYLKDVRIYNRALTETEVSALYRLGENKSLSDGLVLDMPLNEGSGTTVYDKSKYSNNGEITGATWVVDEEKGTCLSYNADGNVRCSLLPSASAFSFCAWVKLADLIGCGHLAMRGSIWNNGTWAIYNSTTSRYVYFEMQNDAGTRLGVNMTISDVEWMFVVAVYDGSFLKIYRNGVFQNSRAHSGTVSGGTFFNVGSTTFKGKLKDARYYNRALTETEIKQLYRLTKKGVE